ncbi:MAG: ElyC/SanA/YdcF family protein [Candidatus Magasanikbacteria bacterium]
MFKKILLSFLILILLTIFSIIITDKIVEKNTENKTYNSLADIPHNKVGLLLGTSKFLVDGRVNAYYSYRIEATKKLFEAKKIDFVLVSGDNGTISYDEPTVIKKDLLESGIPTSSIFLDYAGFRTLDSIVRSKEIFGQNSITVISQKFHNERAIFIAEKKGIEAIGYNAQDVSTYFGLKTQLREKLARLKMMFDLLFHTQPKFFGEKLRLNKNIPL